MLTEEKLYEHERAKAWRIRHRYTRRQISELTGFSLSSIDDFETGIISGNKTRPVGPNAARRYRLCLAAIAHGLEDWDYTDGSRP